ncbi:MAG: SOS response-associated peptidase [Magnetococcales bacterium]|nr:SOS response-associated peptidase [Magnetococcales bacterium]
MTLACMCGRFAQINAERRALEVLGGAMGDVCLEPSYNVAPSQDAHVIIQQGEAQMAMMSWGLIPAWSKEKGRRPINARVETVTEKPSFRDAFKVRRCLVPVDGFYEWTEAEGGKQPWWIRRADGGPMVLAGLWDAWQDPAGKVLRTFTILTTGANPALRTLHHRMPLMLGVRRASAWLDGAASPQVLQAILDYTPSDELSIHAVDRQVNSPRYNAPECLDPVEADPGS